MQMDRDESERIKLKEGIGEINKVELVLQIDANFYLRFFKVFFEIHNTSLKPCKTDFNLLRP